MRYLHKFKGDSITEQDLMPVSMDELVLEIPEPGMKTNSLLDLPIRVKTRFRGGKNSARRRVVSTPIFDLVTPAPWDLEEPPGINDDMQMSMPLSRKPLDPKERSLSSLPMRSKRVISMPMERRHNLHHEQSCESLKSQESERSEASYTSIIQFYNDHAPFTNPLTPIPSLPTFMETDSTDSPTSSDSASDDFSIVEENFNSSASIFSIDPVMVPKQRPTTSASSMYTQEALIDSKVCHRKPPPQQIEMGKDVFSHPMWAV